LKNVRKIPLLDWEGCKRVPLLPKNEGDGMTERTKKQRNRERGERKNKRDREKE